MKLSRIYHHIDNWEEMKFNMWGTVKDKKQALEYAIIFTGNHKLYGSFMQKVIVEWPISCENALTDNLLNRKAWIGHAAASMAINSPEDITRLAWGRLTNEQRFLANNEAKRAIIAWEKFYIKDRGLSEVMGEEMLF